MLRRSAGLLVHRRRGGRTEVLLVHPGGPFWARKDLGAWSVPKGEHDADEDALAAARREFAEETGHAAPGGPTSPLGELRQSGGKRVTVWAVEGDLDASRIESNPVTMEWPRGSGRSITFPEVDRAGWFDLDEARRRILRSQLPALDALEQLLDARGGC